MTSWDERFNDHALWSKVESLDSLLSAEAVPEDEGDRDTYEYVAGLLEILRQYREQSVPLLITSTMLDAANSAVDQLASYVEGWRAETYRASQVDTHVEGVVTTLATWPPLQPEQVAQAQRAASERLSVSTTQAIESVVAARDEVATKLEELKDAEQALVVKFEEQSAAVMAALADFKSEADERLQETSNAWRDSRQEQENLAATHLSSLRDLETEAKELVHATTGSTVATDYGKYARNKTIAAWACDIAAALIGAVGVAAIIYHLYQSDVTADGNVGLSLTRLGASLGTLGIAALVAHRGHDHHKEARAAKRTDLALRRVGPFTANLPPDAREEITLEVTDRIFIRGQLGDATDDEPETSLLDRVKELRRVAEERA